MPHANMAHWRSLLRAGRLTRITELRARLPNWSTGALRDRRFSKSSMSIYQTSRLHMSAWSCARNQTARQLPRFMSRMGQDRSPSSCIFTVADGSQEVRPVNANFA